MKVLVNDKIVQRDTIKIDIEDRGYQFGDGVYEVINLYNGQFFTLEEHLERLERSANEIGMALPFTLEELKENLLLLQKENKMKKGSVYLQVTRGVAPRTHQYAKSLHTMLVAYPLPYKELTSLYENGATAITGEDLRWLRCDIKSLNLLYNIMMKQKAYDQGAFETILIRDGVVTEGTSSNVFMIKDSVIYTHPANNLILNGITRMELLSLFKGKNWTYKEKAFTKDDLFQAAEIFTTSTTTEVVPIVSIDGKVVGDGKPGRFTKQIHQSFTEVIKEKLN
ncbi:MULTISPECIES: D-amino-acid transaminase [Bacillus]|uniref:D-amino-acid transaminase n=1 Tax=Bacillus TaxID=1386 RepID=UPI000BB6F1ED|nr:MULTISPECIES: D-amino-acid transaminase [Bacillus]